MKRILSLFLLVLLSFSLISCSMVDVGLKDEINNDNIEESLNEVVVNDIKQDGYYSSKEDVSLYIHIYDKLPNNFITKKEAEKLGWESSKGNLWDVADKMSIGGDSFGNREKILPTKEKRKYYECDINYEGGFRGSDRIVYSNDGRIYYTEDHYETFVLLYGDE